MPGFEGPQGIRLSVSVWQDRRLELATRQFDFRWVCEPKIPGYALEENEACDEISCDDIIQSQERCPQVHQRQFGGWLVVVTWLSS